MKKNKLLALTILSLMSLAVLAACQKSPTSPESPKTDTSLSSTTLTSSTADDTNSVTDKAAVTLDEAIALYQETYPDSDITSLDLDSSFTNWYYTVEGVNDTTEFELRIDATTKALDKKKEEALDTDERDGLKRQKDKLNLEKLVPIDEITTIALAEVGAGEATDWELAKELAITYWTVTIKDGSNESDVKINAQTKEVLEVELDD